MNIYDIAQKAGVSIATVSRVMNGSGKVSAQTRDRVLKIIEEENYTPNIFAQGLGQGTAHTVGILVPDIDNLYMSSALSCLENALTEAGYLCILGCSTYAASAKEAHVRMMLDKKVAALILVGSTYAGSGLSPEETDYIREAAKTVPVFLINGQVDGKDVYCATCDDRSAVLEVTKALLENGRRRILFLSDSHSFSARQKLSGYEEAHRALSLEPDPSLNLHIHNNIEETKGCLKALFPPNGPQAFDAVAAVEDGLAIGALKYAQEAGIRVPEDLEIVGYNNSRLCQCCTPELTSVDGRLSDLCRVTVENLINVLDGEDDVPALTTLPALSLRRGTTKN